MKKSTNTNKLTKREIRFKIERSTEFNEALDYFLNKGWTNPGEVFRMALLKMYNADRYDYKKIRAETTARKEQAALTGKKPVDVKNKEIILQRCEALGGTYDEAEKVCKYENHDFVNKNNIISGDQWVSGDDLISNFDFYRDNQFRNFDDASLEKFKRTNNL